MQEKTGSTPNWVILAFLIITGTCSVMLISHLVGAGLLHLNIYDPGLLFVDGLLSLVGMIWAASTYENSKSPEVKAKEAQEAAQESYNNAYANEDSMKPFPRLYPVNYLIAWSAIASALKNEPIFVGGQPRKWTVNIEDRDGAELQAYFVHGIEPNVTTLCLTARFVELEPGTRVIFEFQNVSVLAPTDGKKLIKITLDNIIGVMSQAFPPGAKCIVEVPEYKVSASALRAAEWKPRHDAQVGILTVITVIGLLVGTGWGLYSFFQAKPADQSSQPERVESTSTSQPATPTDAGPAITSEPAATATDFESSTTADQSTPPVAVQPPSTVPSPAASVNLPDERPLADAAVREYLALAANRNYAGCRESTVYYQGIDPAQYPQLWRVLPSRISSERPKDSSNCSTMVEYDGFALQFDTLKGPYGIWKVHSISLVPTKPENLLPAYAKPITQQQEAVPSNGPQTQFDPNSQFPSSTVDPGLEIHGRRSIPEGNDSSFKQRLPADTTLPTETPNPKFAEPPQQDWGRNAERRRERELDPSGIHP